MAVSDDEEELSLNLGRDTVDYYIIFIINQTELFTLQLKFILGKIVIYNLVLNVEFL